MPTPIPIPNPRSNEVKAGLILAKSETDGITNPSSIPNPHTNSTIEIIMTKHFAHPYVQQHIINKN